MPGSDRVGGLRGRKMPAVYGDKGKVMGLGPMPGTVAVPASLLGEAEPLGHRRVEDAERWGHARSTRASTIA